MSANPAPVPSRAERAITAAATLVAVLAFLAPWWNRHLGLSLDGYMPWFGHRILRGEIPYRDFFLHLPPLQPLAEAALEALVGKSIVAGRVAGAIGHLLIGLVVALWLLRTHRPAVAVFSSLAALALATSDDTEILDLYNPHAALAAIVSGWLAARALEHRRRADLVGALSGAAAAISFWTKQTIGLGATVAVPFALVLLAWSEPPVRRAARRLGFAFAGGWIATAAPIVLWLAVNGAWIDFLQQVFVDASGSKGSPLRLLVRPWLAPIEMPAELSGPGWVALGLAVVVAPRLVGATIARRDGERPLRALWGTALAVAAIGLGAWLAVHRISWLSGREILQTLSRARNTCILFALYGVTWMGVVSFVTALRRRTTARSRELLLFTMVASAIAVTQALSFSVTGALACPAIALVLARSLSGPSERRFSRVAGAVAIAVGVVAIVTSTALLHIRPFHFAGWSEPGYRSSNVSASEPALAGMRLSPRTAGAVDGVLAALREATDPGEPIFTYSVYPIFYWLSDRPPATFASLHWTDVTPDRIVSRDLDALLADPPVAVVWQGLSPRVLVDNEEYFRGGVQSAVRQMNRELSALLTDRYLPTFRVPPPSTHRERPLEVWVRRDRILARGLKVVD